MSHNTPEGKAKQALHAKDQQRRRGAMFTQIKLERGCADCGYKAHPAALQWDHVRGEKLFNVGQASRTRSSAVVLVEIEKCEVVCANCHAIRTYERGQYRKAYERGQAARAKEVGRDVDRQYLQLFPGTA